MKLPRGIWYERDRDRYRVRLYKNKVPFLKGYYPTLDEAVAALEALKRELAKVPKVPARRRGDKGKAPVPVAGALGALQAIRDRSLLDPRLLKRKV